jgi:hypothetical protein
MLVVRQVAGGSSFPDRDSHGSPSGLYLRRMRRRLQLRYRGAEHQSSNRTNRADGCRTHDRPIGWAGSTRFRRPSFHSPSSIVKPALPTASAVGGHIIPNGVAVQLPKLTFVNVRNFRGLAICVYGRKHCGSE